MAEKEAEKQQREQTRLTTRAERGALPSAGRLLSTLSSLGFMHPASAEG